MAEHPGGKNLPLITGRHVRTQTHHLSGTFAHAGPPGMKCILRIRMAGICSQVYFLRGRQLHPT